MSNFKPNYFQRRSKPQGPRANERIRAIDVQVIGSDGKNIGTLPLNKAIETAKEEGLDLIEISPNANPPVCKIMDKGKYKYDLQKKANLAKKKQKIVALKEIKLRPGTDVHDYNFKIKNAKKFLSKGDKVKFTVKFKGSLLAARIFFIKSSLLKVSCFSDPSLLTVTVFSATSFFPQTKIIGVFAKECSLIL